MDLAPLCPHYGFHGRRTGHAEAERWARFGVFLAKLIGVEAGHPIHGADGFFVRVRVGPSILVEPQQLVGVVEFVADLAFPQRLWTSFRARKARRNIPARSSCRVPAG